MQWKRAVENTQPKHSMYFQLQTEYMDFVNWKKKRMDDVNLKNVEWRTNHGIDFYKLLETYRMEMFELLSFRSLKSTFEVQELFRLKKNVVALRQKEFHCLLTSKLTNDDMEIGEHLPGHFNDCYRVKFKKGTFCKRETAVAKVLLTIPSLHEVKTKLELVKHPNIVTYLAYVSEPFVNALVMESADFTLLDYLRAKGELSSGKRGKWANQLCTAVEYLHTGMDHPIIHRHIASSKCLMFPQGVGENHILKLSDYDFFAKFWKCFPYKWNGEKENEESSDYFHSTFAPEVLEHFLFSTASDIYALATVLLEMKVDEPVVRRCFSSNPQDRPPIQELLASVLTDV